MTLALDDFGIWLAGREMGEGTQKGNHPLRVVDWDSLIKVFYNRARTTSTSLLQRNVAFSSSISRTWWPAAALKSTARQGMGIAPRPLNPPNELILLGRLQARCTALIYISHQAQSVNECATCSKVIYDKHLHGRNLAMIFCK